MIFNYHFFENCRHCFWSTLCTHLKLWFEEEELIVHFSTCSFQFPVHRLLALDNRGKNILLQPQKIKRERNIGFRRPSCKQTDMALYVYEWCNQKMLNIIWFLLFGIKSVYDRWLTDSSYYWHVMFSDLHLVSYNSICLIWFRQNDFLNFIKTLNAFYAQNSFISFIHAHILKQNI